MCVCVWGGLTRLQRCSRFILLLQLTGQSINLNINNQLQFHTILTLFNAFCLVQVNFHYQFE